MLIVIKFLRKIYVQEEVLWLPVVEVSLTPLIWAEVKQRRLYSQRRLLTSLSWQPESSGVGGDGGSKRGWRQDTYSMTYSISSTHAPPPVDSTAFQQSVLI